MGQFENLSFGIAVNRRSNTTIEDESGEEVTFVTKLEFSCLTC